SEAVFGYPVEELIGQSIGRLLPGPFAGEAGPCFAEPRPFGMPQAPGTSRQCHGRRHDGSSFPVHVTLSTPWDQGRRLTCIVRDITQEKEAQERALQAERLAAIGQMMTGLAHESRNAL